MPTTSAINEIANAENTSAYSKGYKHGATKQRKAWSDWFYSLPQDLQDAIQQHRLGGVIKTTRHKDGSLSIRISAAQIG